MADERNVLCFLFNKYGRIASKTLKLTVISTLSMASLAAVKSQLTKDIDTLLFDNEAASRFTSP